ncbi:MAG: DNA polymerase Y family protein [Steroidobacteraceae bacterium]
MLWLCLRLPHLAIELREPAPAGPAAVTDRRGARRVLIACNQAARELGVFHELDATVALAREPQLKLLERSRTGEAQALRALAGWAEQFSSQVSFDALRWCLWLEVGASLRYFGNLATLSGRVREGISLLGYSAQLGIAPTPESAALLAVNDQSIAITALPRLRAVLDPLPLESLALEEKAHTALRASGLKLVGEVLELPAAALSRRFGPAATDYLRRLLGQAPDLRRPYRSPPRYRRVFEFAEGVENVEGLLFPLRRLLQEFQGFLRGRDTAIQTLKLELTHHDAPDTALTLHTSSPQRDALRLFALLREKLERTTLPEAVLALRLSAQQFVPLGATQGDLFDPAPQHDAGWSELLDKLRARLGEHCVRYLGLVDDHRPEKAWCVQDSGQPAELPPGFPTALWILEPRPLRPRLPQLLEHAGAHHAAGGSRRTRAATTISPAPPRARWWLYREAATQQWYLQGLWG